MRKLKLLTFFAAILLCFVNCSPKAEVVEEEPIFWTWSGYGPKQNWDTICTEMQRYGVTGLILNAKEDGLRHVIPIAKKYGIKVHAWVWSLNDGSQVKDHPEWYSVNRLGHSLADSIAYVGYYKFLCPIIPEAREHVKEKFRRICQIEGLEGVSLDYHRFVDVILPTTLWAKYGIVQDKEYAQWDYGYHPEMIKAFQAEYGYSPLDLEDPSTDEKWLQFRCDQVTSLANEIGEIAHEYGKQISASPFPTPEMSRSMVRQDWGKWKLDVAFPMIYHGFYTKEISFIEDCVADCVEDKYEGTDLYCGIVSNQFRENNQSVADGIRAALKGGAKGVAFFQFSNLNQEERESVKILGDSIRAARK
ncbi:MAG: family 10 glycosylhydrolase [Rikenellaceae bacterium]